MLIPLRSPDSELLAPLQQHQREQQNNEQNARSGDVQVLNPHAVEPWRQNEKDDDGEDVAAETS